MIRSLYVRVALTFVIAVVLGLIVAFFTTTYLFSDRFKNELQHNLELAALDVIETVQTANTDDPAAALRSLNWLNGYLVRIYDADRRMTVLGMKGDQKEIPPDVVDQVLGGQSVLQTLGTGGPLVNFSGRPFTLNEKRYAVFIQPAELRPTDNFQLMLNSTLTIVLVIGSVFVLLAARYLVKPLKLMTHATQRISKGDFNVQLGWLERKDEVGDLARSFEHMAAELQQLERMRQDFISNVSHEIQSPLTSIAGFSKLIRYSELSVEERNHYLGIIQTESERLSRLSDNMLKLASLESEHHPFHPVSFRLDEQIRRIIAAQEPLWSHKQLEVTVSMPSTVIMGDEDQLSQVWTNLFHNAIKFTEAKGTIGVTLESKVDKVRITFRDSGIGMTGEELEHIFERFYKADRSRQRTFGGSGLGLPIVRKIIELHGGDIIVRSERGSGSVFQVDLPSFIINKPKLSIHQ